MTSDDNNYGHEKKRRRPNHTKAENTMQSLTHQDLNSNLIYPPTSSSDAKFLPPPSNPHRPRIGVGVVPSYLWSLTFLSLILLSATLSPSPSPTNNVRRRVRGTWGGGSRGLRLFESSTPPSYYNHISSPIPTTPSSTPAFDLDESKRLLRLESASPLSYLYRYRAPRTTSTLAAPTPTSPSYRSSHPQPRVLLRLNGQSGVITRRADFATPEPPPTTTTTTTKAPPQEESHEKSDKAVEDHDYPYHYYLDFDENQGVSSVKGQNPAASSVVGEYLYPQPSEHLKPFALPETQSSLWNDFLQNSNQPLPPPLLPSYLNEIVDGDNYTIPSLRGYKFPEYKTITTTTKKPSKHNNFLNPYEFFSEEDLENVADLDFDSDHSKYFVKTKPRDVSSSVANLYNSFYYEPPSYSTKSQPLPVNNAKFPEILKSPDKPAQKWSRIRGGSELHYNFFNNEQGTLVTFPMTATPSPSPTPTVTDMSSYLSQTPLQPTTTPNPLNLSGYYYNPPTGSQGPEQRNDVATAESVAVLASKSSSLNLNFNLIPELGGSSSFLHKDGNLDPAIISTTTPTSTTPVKIESTQDFSTTTPSSGSDRDTTNIPGMPGIDYPIFDEIPATGFDCTKQRYKGFFADIESKCQVWHYCDFADGHSSFLCPNGTLFSQVLLTCDWWFNVNCIQSQQLYVLNERLYRYIKPPKPSFPEDYHGPGVDTWLKKQLELGLLPKIKKRGKQLQLQLEKPVPTTLREKVEMDVDNDNATTTTTEYPGYASQASEEKNDQE